MKPESARANEAMHITLLALGFKNDSRISWQGSQINKVPSLSIDTDNYSPSSRQTANQILANVKNISNRLILENNLQVHEFASDTNSIKTDPNMEIKRILRIALRGAEKDIDGSFFVDQKNLPSTSYGPTINFMLSAVQTVLIKNGIDAQSILETVEKNNRILIDKFHKRLLNKEEFGKQYAQNVESKLNEIISHFDTDNINAVAASYKKVTQMLIDDIRSVK